MQFPGKSYFLFCRPPFWLSKNKTWFQYERTKPHERQWIKIWLMILNILNDVKKKRKKAAEKLVNKWQQQQNERKMRTRSQLFRKYGIATAANQRTIFSCHFVRFVQLMLLLLLLSLALNVCRYLFQSLSISSTFVICALISFFFANIFCLCISHTIEWAERSQLHNFVIIASRFTITL